MGTNFQADLAGPTYTRRQMSALSMRAPGAHRVAVASAAAAVALVGAAALRYGPAALALPLAAAARGGAAAAPARGGRPHGGRSWCSARAAATISSASPAACTTRCRSARRRWRPCSRGRAGGAARPAPRRAPGPAGRPAHACRCCWSCSRRRPGRSPGVFAGIGTEDLVFAARQLTWLAVVPLLVVNVVETRARGAHRAGVRAGLALLKAVLGVVGGGGRASAWWSTAPRSPTTSRPPTGWCCSRSSGCWRRCCCAPGRRSGCWPARRCWCCRSRCRSAARSGSARRSACCSCSCSGRGARAPAGRWSPACCSAVAVWTARAPAAARAEAPIVERARSLEPSKVEQNAQDRYRIDELENVTAEIRRQPITGLGLGGEWTAGAPARGGARERAQLHARGRLWWWLKLGILGLLAYLAVMATCLAMSWQVWRRSADPPVSRPGWRCSAGCVALVVVETVGSFTGVDPRFTALVGAVGGLLVVMRRLALRPRPRRSASSASARSPTAAGSWRAAASARAGAALRPGPVGVGAVAGQQGGDGRRVVVGRRDRPGAGLRPGRWRPRRRWPPRGARSACRARSPAARPRSGTGRRPPRRSRGQQLGGLGARCSGRSGRRRPSGAARRSQARPRSRPRRSSAGARAGRARRRAARAASIATSLRFLALKRVRQPITKASSGTPSARRCAAPASGSGRKRPGSIALGTHAPRARPARRRRPASAACPRRSRARPPRRAPARL